MTIFQIIAIILTFAAAAGYINNRYVRLPATIGYMVMALLLTLEEGVDLLEADTPRNVTGFINNAEDLARDVRNILKHYGKKI